MSNHSPKDWQTNKKKNNNKPSSSLFLNLSAYNRMRRRTSPGFQSSDSSSPSFSYNDDAAIDENSGESKEWTVGIDNGVLITYVSLPAGNDLKRVQFRKDLFDTQRAERWWGENFERIKKQCNVQRIKGKALPTPPESSSPPSLSSPSMAVSVSARIVEMREWVEQDEPGVYLTICELADGTRYLLSARFRYQPHFEVLLYKWN